MKKSLVIFSLCGGVFFLSGCAKEKEKEPPQTVSAVEITANASQTLYADQTEGAEIAFTATGNWTAETAVRTKAAAPEWMTIAPASGGAGSNIIAVTLELNDTGADRTAAITISSGGEQAEVSVTQKATTVDGELYTEKYDFYAGGEMGWFLARNHQSVGTGYYYKNGEAIYVPAVISNGSPRITDFTVSGNDVHVVGYESGSESGVSVTKARYWKNGQHIALPSTQLKSWATGIDVVGSDVYISGYEEIPVYNSLPIYVAKYWKNGVAYTLGNAVENSFAYGIKVAGNDACVLGYQRVVINNTSFKYYFGYWKNGQLITLNYSNGVSEVYDFFVSGQDVYVLGGGSVALDDGKFRSDEVYWKNQTPFRITDIGTSVTTGVSGIAALGGDVYVIGHYQYGYYSTERSAFYWNDGEMTVLGQGDATAITVVDGDVYITANRTEAQSIRYYDIYKNGVVINSHRGNGGYRLVVVPHSPTRTW